MVVIARRTSEGGTVLVSPPQPEPAPNDDDPLAERIREIWAEHDGCTARARMTLGFQLRQTRQSED